MSYIYGFKPRAILLPSSDFEQIPIVFEDDLKRKSTYHAIHDMFAKESFLKYLFKAKEGLRTAILFQKSEDDLVLKRLQQVLSLDLRRGWDGYYWRKKGKWALAFVLTQEEEDHFLKNSYPPVDFRLLDSECSFAYFLPKRFYSLFRSENQLELLRYYSVTLGMHGCFNPSWCLAALLYFSQQPGDKAEECSRALYDFGNILGVRSKMMWVKPTPALEDSFSSLEDEMVSRIIEKYNKLKEL